MVTQRIHFLHGRQRLRRAAQGRGIDARNLVARARLFRSRTEPGRGGVRSLASAGRAEVTATARRDSLRNYARARSGDSACVSQRFPPMARGL